MLTNGAVKAARARASAYKLGDGHGLYLHVLPSGLKAWRIKYRIAGDERVLTVGSWPEVSLLDARARCDQLVDQLARGLDPRNCASTEVHNFEIEARAWHAHQSVGWTAVHASDVLASLERDVFPAIGAMPLAAITPPVLLNALRLIEGRGARETARRVRQRISAVFGYAIASGRAEQDPAAIVGRVLAAPAPARHHPALLEADDARALLAAVELVDAAPVVKLASLFLALTAVRLAAVRGARWSEIENLDGDGPVWRVPAARMKLAAAKKASVANDHLVPLSPAAVAVLRNLHPHDANSHDLIFPGRGGASIGEAAIGAVYVRAGFSGRHVPHGWRASFATILNELFPGERDAIDRALAHAARDKVEAAYNRSEQLARRRRLFDAWATVLIGDAKV